MRYLILNKLKENKRKIEAGLFGLAAILAITIIHLYISLYTPKAGLSGGGEWGEAKAGVETLDTPVQIQVLPGASFSSVARSLKDAELIGSTLTLKVAAKILGYQAIIKAGDYELSPSQRPIDILNALVKGTVKEYRVTIPEGYNLTQVAETLERRGLADKNEFLKVAKSQKVTAALGFSGLTLEGYLFPDTYRFRKGLPELEIVKAMTRRFREVFEEEGFKEEILAQGKTIKEVVTLASMIEKETGMAFEMAEISSVFHNRINKGIPLASDPTVIYGIDDFDGNITREHLRTKTPYNTYRFKGLPPGPIAGPGKRAIVAALNPMESNNLYFVAKGDGTHKFSRTLKEHNRAVYTYQIKKRR